MNRDERIVVVGAGLTGLRAAERLRELRFEGEIMLVGDEKQPPYHRPALSKQLLMGTLRSSDLTLPAYEDLNAKWRFGTQVRQLVPHNKVLHLPGGEELTYDGLVIATGVEAKRPGGLPYYDPRVLVLRTMADGLDLERVIGSTKGRVAVVGGGFTGCEIAASLRHLSREVTLIGRRNTLLGNVLGPELGDWLTNLHRDHGVDLALGNSVQEWSPGPEGIGLRLTDGSTLLASCVVVAAGTVPLTGWLRGSGLPLDNGVVCEPTCHVVGAEDVVAAGDVAQWPNLRFDNVPRRVEHWLNAVEMGRAAAESLLAGRAAAEPFTPMPRFWTEQYGVRIQAAGMPKLGKDIITLGTPDEGTGTVYGYSKEGRLMGVVGLDCPSSVLAWTDSVSRQNPAPRQRTPAEPAPAVSVGGSAKRGKGRHSLPAKDKRPRREEKREHEIAYVEEQPHQVGVGVGVVPAGRPKNVVDSFSRMLPVKVRQPRGDAVPPPGTPMNGTPVPPPPGARTNGAPLPPPPGTHVNGRPVNGAPPPLFGAPPNGRPATSGRFPAPTGVTPPQFRVAGGAPEPLSGRLNAEDALAIDVTGQMALLDANGHVRPPEFHDPMAGAATMTGDPSDSFGALPPIRDTEIPPARRGPSSSFNAMPPARRGSDGSFDGTSPVRGPGNPPSGMPAARRDAQASRGGMPPVRRGAQDSFGAMPPARRSAVPRRARGVEGGFGRGTARGPEDPFAPLADSLDRTPPVGGSADETAVDGLPPARGPRAPGPTNGGRAARRRRAEERLSRNMDPALSGIRLVPALPSMDDSFDRLPKHSRPDDDYLVRPRSGPEDSYDRMPAVERPVRSSGGRRRA